MHILRPASLIKPIKEPFKMLVSESSEIRTNNGWHDSAIFALRDLGIYITRAEFADVVISRLDLYCQLVEISHQDEINVDMVIELVAKVYNHFGLQDNTESRTSKNNSLSSPNQFRLNQIITKRPKEYIDTVIQVYLSSETELMKKIGRERYSEYKTNLLDTAPINIHEITIFLQNRGYNLLDENNGYYLFKNSIKTICIFEDKGGFNQITRWAAVLPGGLISGYNLKQVQLNAADAKINLSSSEYSYCLNLTNPERNSIYFIGNNQIAKQISIFAALKELAKWQKIAIIKSSGASSIIALLAACNFHPAKIRLILEQIELESKGCSLYEIKTWIYSLIKTQINDDLKIITDEIKIEIAKAKGENIKYLEFLKKDLATLQKNQPSGFSFAVLKVLHKYKPDEYKNLVLFNSAKISSYDTTPEDNPIDCVVQMLDLNARASDYLDESVIKDILIPYQNLATSIMSSTDSRILEFFKPAINRHSGGLVIDASKLGDSSDELYRLFDQDVVSVNQPSLVPLVTKLSRQSLHSLLQNRPSKELLNLNLEITLTRNNFARVSKELLNIEQAKSLSKIHSLGDIRFIKDSKSPVDEQIRLYKSIVVKNSQIFNELEQEFIYFNFDMISKMFFKSGKSINDFISQTGSFKNSFEQIKLHNQVINDICNQHFPRYSKNAVKINKVEFNNLINDLLLIKEWPSYEFISKQIEKLFVNC